MYKARHWAVRHAGVLEKVYNLLETLVLGLRPVWRTIGYQRIEPVFTFAERHIKGLLFDCKMCGQCALSVSGMSCPMNCPKNLRNGPCGGVRSNGNCEVEPDMKCVWVAAWEGSQKMASGQTIQRLQQPINFTRLNQSAWLHMAKQKQD